MLSYNRNMRERLPVGEGLYKQQMKLRARYKINKLAGIYVKDRSSRRHVNYPSKGLRNVKTFEILKKAEKTAVLLVSPETGRLPDGMGSLARYISGKAGGLGEVVSTLCEGLRARGINCHLATLDLKKRFQSESNMDEHAWRAARLRHMRNRGGVRYCIQFTTFIRAIFL